MQSNTKYAPLDSVSTISVSSQPTPSSSLYPIKPSFINSKSQQSLSSFNFPTPVSNVDTPSFQEVSPAPSSTRKSFPATTTDSNSGSKRKSKNPLKSPSRAEERASSSSPGFVIQLGYGSGQILRMVNYERIPIRVNRPAVSSPYRSNGATKRQPRGLLNNGDQIIIKTRRRQSFTALVSSPTRPPSTRTLSSVKEQQQSGLPPSPLTETATASPFLP